MNTLRIQKQRPLQTRIDLSKVSLQEVMKNYPKLQEDLAVHEGAVKATPEKEALWFYVQQHACSMIERRLNLDEPLGAYGAFVDQYHNEMHWKTLRMFYYLLLICTRESRHASGHAGRKKVFDMHPKIKPFHNQYVQDSSASSAIEAICENAPDVTLGEYTQFLVRMFTYPSYSAGFGGKAWKEVATPLNEFVQGNISAEIMMDTAFTLAHNNGPIFNKGMLYTGYNKPSITKILDVQRSGQIPQLIATYNGLGEFITADMKSYVDMFSKLEPSVKAEVDWSIVKDIHGYVAYSNLITNPQKTGSKWQDWKNKLKAKVAKAKAEAAAAALLKGSYMIMPDVLVPKGERSIKK